MFKKCSIFAKYTKKYKEILKNQEKWGKCAK